MDNASLIDLNHFIYSVPHKFKNSSHTPNINLQTTQPIKSNDFQPYPKLYENRYLLLERIYGDNLFLNTQEIKPLDFFETLSQTCINYAKEKGVKFFIYIDPNIASPITLDVQTLSISLKELISNAIKFTPQGGSIHLDIRQSYLNNQDHLSVSVSDSGIGMIKAKIEKLFKKFQGPTNTGSGLGLASIYYLLQKVGSPLKISSEPTVGSRFTFTLPFTHHTQAQLTRKKSLRIGIMQNDQNMDEYTRQLFSYLLATGSKLVNIENSEDPQLNSCQALFVINKAFNRHDKDSLAQRYPNTIIIPTFLESFDNHYTISKDESDYKLLLPLLPSAILKCFNYISMHITQKASQTIKPAPIKGLPEPKINHDLDSQANDTFQILLVEDNTINIKWTLMLLGRYDYDITYAENGEIAVDMAKQKRFDLILMDIDMPIMNGIEATQHIKNFEKEFGLKNTPIVALTSHDQEGERENILAQGLDEHLGKPLNLRELEDMVDKYSQNNAQVTL